MRNLKVLGVTLVVILATTAIGGDVAWGNQFHSKSSNTTWTVASNETQKFTYETGGVTIECTTIGGSGFTTKVTVEAVKFTPTYSGCKAAGIGGSSVDTTTNGCSYITTIGATKNQGVTHTDCGEKSITYTITVIGFSICTFHVGGLITPKGESDYSNSEATRITVQRTETGIPATRQGSSECGAASSTTGSLAGRVQYKGDITGQATETGIQVE